MLETLIIISWFHQATTFVVTTDASGYAIGGILSQGTTGKDLSIACYVRPTYVTSISAKRFAISALVTTSLLKLTNNGAIPAPTPKQDTWVNQIPKSYLHQRSPSGDKRARAWLRCASFFFFFLIFDLYVPDKSNSIFQESHCEGHSFNIYISFSVVTKRHFLFFSPSSSRICFIEQSVYDVSIIYIYGHEISLSARTKADALPNPIRGNRTKQPDTRRLAR